MLQWIGLVALLLSHSVVASASSASDPSLASESGLNVDASSSFAQVEWTPSLSSTAEENEACDDCVPPTDAMVASSPSMVAAYQRHQEELAIDKKYTSFAAQWKKPSRPHRFRSAHTHQFTQHDLAD